LKDYFVEGAAVEEERGKGLVVVEAMDEVAATNLGPVLVEPAFVQNAVTG
jgi:hypothetical protein